MVFNCDCMFFKSKNKANLYQIENFAPAVSSQALSPPSLPQIVQKILHQNQLLPTACYQTDILQFAPQGYQNDVLQLFNLQHSKRKRQHESETIQNFNPEPLKHEPANMNQKSCGNYRKLCHQTLQRHFKKQSHISEDVPTCIRFLPPELLAR